MRAYLSQRYFKQYFSALFFTLSFIALNACKPESGEEGTKILVPYENLSGGILFSTARLSGSYNLHWIQDPQHDQDIMEPQKITEAGDIIQPSMSAGKKGFAYARTHDGIFYVGTDSVITRVTDTRGTNLFDSLPALSFEGDWVAFVREDRDKPLSDSGFFQTQIMLKHLGDESAAYAASPKENVVQDAPSFEPLANSTRLVWSEFSTVGFSNTDGPSQYGIFLFDRVNKTGRLLCSAPAFTLGNASYRCFGQHTSWLSDNTVLLPQQFFTVNINTTTKYSALEQLLNQTGDGLTGTPIREAAQPGFFAPFPLSSDFTLTQNAFVFDGIVKDRDGNTNALAIYKGTADAQGIQGIFRVQIQNYSQDNDTAGTSNFLFSLATPKYVP